MANQLPLKNIGIRTEFGPIGLRSEFDPPREPYVMQVPQMGQQTIRSKWLSGQEANYQRCIKQAMLIAATHVKLRDAQDAFAKIQNRDQMFREAKARAEALQAGKEQVRPLDTHKKRTVATVQRVEDRTRSMLVKFSHKPCCAKRERCFIVDGGDLKVYRSHTKNAPITKDTCSLIDCNVSLEHRVQGTYQYPHFEAEFKQRIVVRNDKREAMKKTPFYLYGTDKQLKAWMRAFKMAKILVRDNDRKCMMATITRSASGSLLKAYACLLTYFQELHKTGEHVRTMAKRLVEVEPARGWLKLKLVYQKEHMKTERAKAQQIWASRFMSEKLSSLGSMTVKPIGEIRESVVTRIQNSFRLYRDSKIFDRTYPIGTKVVSRMRKAKQGFSSDVQIETLTCQESLRLGLTDATALQHLREFPDAFESRKSTYSEVQSSPVTSMDMRMSDNFQSLLFYMNEGGPDASQLSKTEFSNFISVDRISSVVLNSCPRIGSAPSPKQDGGVWCTIYGPRLGYGRFVKDAGQDKTTGEHIYEISGAKDSFAVPRALADGGSGAYKCKWITTKVAKPTLSYSGADIGESQTYCVVHILGFSFKSKKQKGMQTSFTLEGDTAKVPICDEEGGVAALDSSMVGVEIFCVSDGKETLLLVGAKTLLEAYGISAKTFKGESYPFTSKKDVRFSLSQPYEAEGGGRKDGVGSFDLNIEFITTDWSKTGGCLSPEFAGGGFGTTLYTSHRGAWYDPIIGPGHFRVDHVPNFVEIKLGQLHLTSKVYGKVSGDEAPCIRIRASINGVSVTCGGMHRAKPSWVNVVGPQHADPDAIDFSGMRLCLPLPPGCWKDYAKPKEESAEKDKEPTAPKSPRSPGEPEPQRPVILIEIIQGEEDSGAAYTYDEAAKGDAGSTKPPLETILYTSIQYEQLVMVDDVKSLQCFLGKEKTKVPVVNAFSNAVTANANTTKEDVLNIETVLRDRDYVRCSMGKSGDNRDLYVGDKVMVMVESPLEYPSSQIEFRQRFIQGLAHQDAKCPESLRKYDKELSGKEFPGAKGCKLRAPASGLEYIASNLSSCIPKVVFRQGSIPSYCQDMVPHKYVCPLGETAFNDESRPGIYTRIMDDLAGKLAKDKNAGGGANLAAPAARRVVEHLSHVNRQIPAVLLATYANGTCDVELAAEFVDNWRRMPTCKYLLPGEVVSKQVEDKQAPTTTMQTAQDKTPPKARIVLKGLPTTQIAGTHSSGFHVFNSGFGSTEDALAADPPPSGDFDLRGEDAVMNPGFTLAAGPLPPDASGSSCQYEWALSVRSSSAFDMYQFVSSLRQAVRCDQLMQATRIEALHTQMTGAVLPTRPAHQVSPTSGALEIVLVEARRLRPVDFEQTWKAQESLYIHGAKLGPLREETSKGLIGTKPQGDFASATPVLHKLSTFVEFRLLNQGEEVPVKGAKVQTSSKCDDTDSPCWAAEPGLQNSGGWAFKTGVIDKAETPELQLDFEVKWVSYGQAATLGAIQVPVFKPMPQFGNKCLADEGDAFKSIWLPLMAEVQGQIIHAPLGEIHVFTRWIPPSKLHPNPGQKMHTMKEEVYIQAGIVTDAKMKGTRLREVVAGTFDIEATYATYNPNIVREKQPESPPEHFERNVEALYNTVPYLKCLNIRQEMAWSTFEENFLRGQSLLTARNAWAEQEAAEAPGQEALQKKESPLKDLEELIKTGIPNSRRARYWQDLVGSKDFQGGQYKQYLQRGLPMQNDAMLQVQEDGFHLAGAWESSQPQVPKNLDQLLKKLRKAQNICTALISYDDSGIDYCESILVLAFFLILPHGVMLPEVTIPASSTWMDDLQAALRFANVTRQDWANLGNNSSVEIRNAKGQIINGEIAKLVPGMQAPSSVTDSLGFPISVQDTTETGLSEEEAFWLLVRMVKNGAFKAYYGKDEVWNGNAAMKDVSLLENFIALLDTDLWKYMNSIGFHLSMVFYGAFMRLFATYMPVATVFRFWDLLFAETMMNPREFRVHDFPGHGARQLLVTFAYAIIRSKKSELLLCQSATEITDLLLGVLGSLYDCDTVNELIDASARLMWGFSASTIKVARRVLPSHKDHEEAWEDAHKAMQEQNLILKELMHSRELGFIRGTTPTSDSYGEIGVTAFQVTELVMPALRQNLQRISTREEREEETNHPAGDKKDATPEDKAPIWGMYRPLPRSEQLLTQGWADKTYQHFAKTFRPQVPQNPYPIKAEVSDPSKKPESLPASASSTSIAPVGAYTTIGMEPFFKEYDFQNVMEREINNWSDRSKAIWNAFTNRRDKHHGTFTPNLNPLAKAGITIDNPTFNAFIVKQFVKQPDIKSINTTERFSLNEFFLSMIFLSKGTLGDKAAAVFSVFAHSDTVSKEEHYLPPSQLAKTIIEKSAMHDASFGAGKTTPPDDSVKKNCALHFTIHSKHHKQHEKDEIGHVYIPSVGLFTGASSEDIQEYNIWPSDEKAEEQAKMKAADPLNIDTGPDVIGEMQVAISWSPVPGDDGEGQLTIRMKSVTFYPPIENFRMNPSIEVTTVKNGSKDKIKRWDPRGGLRSTDYHASVFESGVVFGGHIIFPETMNQTGSVGNESFYQLVRHGEQQGFIGGKWTWNSTWGKQLSVENYKFPSPSATEMPTSSNCMCLKFARYIVHCLLTRTLVNVSNRQCMLIADSVFNRLGVVPGILGAILVPTSSLSDFKQSLTKVRKDFDEKKVKYIDVTGELALEQERQMVDNGGTFNLFSPTFLALSNNKITLADMGIKAPSTIYEQCLVVRFVRGGDGERVTKYVKFNRDGSLASVEGNEEANKMELELDLPPSSLMCTKVTKEEFVNCFLHCPLLGEALRDMAAYDRQSPDRKTVSLDVMIIDPRQTEQAKEAEQASHFSQTLLAEVWDDDTFSKDLLGEVWLPALSTIPGHARDYVLPLVMPDFSSEGENGPSRHHRTKESYDAKTTKYKAEGEIYIRLGWEFPAYEMGADGKSVILKSEKGDQKKAEPMTDQVLIQQKLNTGRLTIKVDHARHLRRSDARRGRDCDPKVQVFLRNDAMDHWRKKPVYSTTTVKNNRNPSWKDKHEEKIEVVQGDFEQKYPPRGETLFEAAKYAMKTKRTKRREEDERRLNVVKNTMPTVNINFGRGGGDHGVEVYLNDSIREFKSKLLEACKKQAKSMQGPDKSLYEEVKIGPKHLVTVYVPPLQVQRMSLAGRQHGNTELEHQKRIAIEDPKNWQPLDPSRTFEMYKTRYQFGDRKSVQIRIMEASDKLKMQNLMYKEFLKQQNKKLSIDMNEDETCFGWAKYKHESDDSFEWRRALISNAKDGSKDAKTAADASKYNVAWLAKTLPSSQAKPEPLDRQSVMLQPRLPKMDHYVHPAHEQILVQARQLRAMGKSDYEIEVMLNKILEDKNKPGSGADKTKAATTKPPRITVDIIKNYLAHNAH